MQPAAVFNLLLPAIFNLWCETEKQIATSRNSWQTAIQQYLFNLENNCNQQYLIDNETWNLWKRNCNQQSAVFNLKNKMRWTKEKYLIYNAKLQPAVFRNLFNQMRKQTDLVETNLKNNHHSI